MIAKLLAYEVQTVVRMNAKIKSPNLSVEVNYEEAR